MFGIKKKHWLLQQIITDKAKIFFKVFVPQKII